MLLGDFVYWFLDSPNLARIQNKNPNRYKNQVRRSPSSEFKSKNRIAHKSQLARSRVGARLRGCTHARSGAVPPSCAPACALVAGAESKRETRMQVVYANAVVSKREPW